MKKSSVSQSARASELRKRSKRRERSAADVSARPWRASDAREGARAAAERAHVQRAVSSAPSFVPHLAGPWIGWRCWAWHAGARLGLLHGMPTCGFLKRELTLSWGWAFRYLQLLRVATAIIGGGVIAIAKTQL